MSTDTSSGGVGFVGLLQVAFIVLRLTGQITWSWLWVLAPAWISVSLVALVVLVVVAVGIVVHLVKK